MTRTRSRATFALLLVTGIFLTAAASAAATVGSWTQVGANAQHTGASTDTTISATQASSPHVRWLLQAPHSPLVQPAVWQGFEYQPFSPPVGGGAIDVVNNDVLQLTQWATSGEIADEPVIDESLGRLWVIDSTGTLDAFDARCRTGPCPVVAHASVGSCPTACTASPVVGGGLVLAVTSDGHLAAYRGNCSAVCGPLWTADLGANAGSTPSLSGDLALVGSSGGAVEAFRLNCAAHRAACSPIWRAPSGDTGGNTVAIDPSTGIALWTSPDGNLYGVYGCPQHGSGITCRPKIVMPLGGGPLHTTPVVDSADGLVIVARPEGTVDAFHLVRCAGAGSCSLSLAWSASLPDPHQAFGDASAALANGVYWIVDTLGALHAYRAGGCGAAVCGDLIPNFYQLLTPAGAVGTEVADGQLWASGQDSSVSSAPPELFAVRFG
jgi:outer membrane protein assembly factor BamB